jgi:hypothetical protein
MTNDLISRSALVENATVMTEYDEGGWGVDLLAVPLCDVKTAPAVDAVEVVRCKDCNHGEIDDPDFPYQYYCHMGHMWNDAYHFCADGERRADK